MLLHSPANRYMVVDAGYVCRELYHFILWVSTSGALKIPLFSFLFVFPKQFGLLLVMISIFSELFCCTTPIWEEFGRTFPFLRASYGPNSLVFGFPS